MARLITPADYVTYLENAAKRIRAGRDYITQLDAATGDGDHWVNLITGFEKVLEQKNALSGMSFQELFGACGMAMMSGVGGSSGVLYGSAYLAAAEAAAGLETLDTAALCRLLEAQLLAIMKRGGARPGYKTMVDPLFEAHRALKDALDEGKSSDEALAGMKAGAIAGMEATRDMEALRGRACYQQSKGVGHLDPGAVTMCWQLQELAHAFMEEE